MVAAANAGLAYAIIVFAVGFILGAIRIPFVVPLAGEIAAVVLEAPLMLMASWLVAR